MILEKYEVPSIEVISFELEGVIAASTDLPINWGTDPIFNPIAD